MKMIKNKFEVKAKEFGAKYFDARLKSQDSKREVKGHKVFLAAVSPRLDELFDENKNSSSDEPVVVRNIGFAALSAIVDFVYTGKIDLSEQTSEFVEVRNISRFCVVAIFTSLRALFRTSGTGCTC